MISGKTFSPFGLGWILICSLTIHSQVSDFLYYSALIFKACLPTISFECALVFGRRGMKYENIPQMHKYKTTSVHKYKTTITQMRVVFGRQRKKYENLPDIHSWTLPSSYWFKTQNADISWEEGYFPLHFPSIFLRQYKVLKGNKKMICVAWKIEK